MDHVALSSHCASPPRPGTRNPVERTWNYANRLRPPRARTPLTDPAPARDRRAPRTVETESGRDDVNRARIVRDGVSSTRPCGSSSRRRCALHRSRRFCGRGSADRVRPGPRAPAGSARSSGGRRDRRVIREIVALVDDLAGQDTFSRVVRRSRGPGRDGRDRGASGRWRRCGWWNPAGTGRGGVGARDDPGAAPARTTTDPRSGVPAGPGPGRGRSAGSEPGAVGAGLRNSRSVRRDSGSRAGAGLRNASSARHGPSRLAPCELSATESACARFLRARLARCEPR